MSALHEAGGMDLLQRARGDGGTQMGRVQTADHSPERRVIRPGPAKGALPHVMAEASQP